jgi:hypothetical protein
VCKNHWSQVAQTTKFYTVARNICESSVQNLFHVNILATIILRWCLNFWKTCGPTLTTFPGENLRVNRKVFDSRVKIKVFWDGIYGFYMHFTFQAFLIYDITPVSKVGNGTFKRHVYRLLLQLWHSNFVRTIKSDCPRLRYISTISRRFANLQYALLPPANYVLLSYTPGQ